MVNGKTWARELKRKSIHALSVLFILPLIYLPEIWVVRFFGIGVIVALVLHWYCSTRQLRGKYFQELVSNLNIPTPDKNKILRNTEFWKKFEEEVIFGFLKDVQRRNEREPLLATFYILLSTFLVIILLGIPFAIFGLLAISFGDAVATLVGKRAGKHKLIYNKEKSIEGWLGFFVATTLAVFIFLTILPQFAVFNSIALALIAGIAGAFIESIPTTNDNTTIPFGIALVIWLLALVL